MSAYWMMPCLALALGVQASSAASAAAAAPATAPAAASCFIDPVWNASELYHDTNHPYGSAFNAETNATQTLLMDFYAPPTTGPRADTRLKRPTVLLIHGGSFIGGDKGSWEPLATVLAQRGFVVGSVNYRLTGQLGRWWIAPPPPSQSVNDIKQCSSLLRLALCCC